MILDTNVLVRLEREHQRRMNGPATQFLTKNASERFFITPTTIGEFGCGQSMAERGKWEEALAIFEFLPLDREVSWIYGEIYRHLASQGKLIGVNDLWIAATALRHDVPVATGNVREFERVPGLRVISVC